MSDPELIASLPIRSATGVISAVPDPNTGVSRHDSRHALLQALTEVGYEGKIAVATHRVEDNEELRNSGARLILHPYYNAADHAIELLHSEEEEDAFEDYEIEEQREL